MEEYSSMDNHCPTTIQLDFQEGNQDDEEDEECDEAAEELEDASNQDMNKAVSFQEALESLEKVKEFVLHRKMSECNV